MKKLLFFFAVATIPTLVNAQNLRLNGTSYTQNFDNIDNALPTGWSLYTNAKDAATLGDQKQLFSTVKGTKFPWWNTTGGFKNVASADGLTASADSITQTNATNRALAVRQVSTLNTAFPNSDPGAAFMFTIDNTVGLSGFQIQFELQSLDDTSHRQTPWMLEYAIGSTTVFSPIATSPATLTTGGDVFSNDTITASLPADAENSAGPIYIRLRTSGQSSIVTSDPQGNRATTAIDNFQLTWTGVANSVAHVAAQATMPLTVIGNATSSQMTLGYTVSKAGKYDVNVYDVAGRVVYKTTINAQAGAQQYTIGNMNLHSGMYIVEMGNDAAAGIVKTMVN